MSSGARGERVKLDLFYDKAYVICVLSVLDRDPPIKLRFHILHFVP